MTFPHRRAIETSLSCERCETAESSFEPDSTSYLAEPSSLPCITLAKQREGCRALWRRARTELGGTSCGDRNGSRDDSISRSISTDLTTLGARCKPIP